MTNEHSHKVTVPHMKWAIGYRQLESGKWRWIIYANDEGFWEDLAYGEAYSMYTAFTKAMEYAKDLEQDVMIAESRMYDAQESCHA